MQPCFLRGNEGSGWHIVGLEKMGSQATFAKSRRNQSSAVRCGSESTACGSGCGGHLWAPLERSFSYHTYITGWHKHTHAQTYWLHTHTTLQTHTAVFIGVGLLVLEDRRTWTPSDTSDAAFPMNWLQLWWWRAKIWCKNNVKCVACSFDILYFYEVLRNQYWAGSISICLFVFISSISKHPDKHLFRIK